MSTRVPLMNPDPERYSQNNVFQHKIYRAVEHSILDEAIKGAVYKLSGMANGSYNSSGETGFRVLDVGCGDGALTHVLHDSLVDCLGTPCQTYGLDSCPEMIEFAKERSRAMGKGAAMMVAPTEDCGIKSHVSFVLGDIAGSTSAKIWSDEASLRESLGVGAGFDMVTSFSCLHWVHDQGRALGNVVGLLRDGAVDGAGRDYYPCHFVLLEKGMESLQYATTKILSMPKWKPFLKDLTSWNDKNLLPWNREWMMSQDPKQTYCNTLVDAGFRSVQAKSLDNGVLGNFFRFSDATVMKESIIAIFPDLPKVPDEVKELILTDFVNMAMVYQKKTYGDPLLISNAFMYVKAAI